MKQWIAIIRYEGIRTDNKGFSPKTKIYSHLFLAGTSVTVRQRQIAGNGTMIWVRQWADDSANVTPSVSGSSGGPAEAPGTRGRVGVRCVGRRRRVRPTLAPPHCSSSLPRVHCDDLRHGKKQQHHFWRVHNDVTIFYERFEVNHFVKLGRSSVWRECSH